MLRTSIERNQDQANDKPITAADIDGNFFQWFKIYWPW